MEPSLGEERQRRVQDSGALVGLLGFGGGNDGMNVHSVTRPWRPSRHSTTSERMSLDPRPQQASRTQMTEYVLPQHANALGSVFGGQIMAWVDLCAAICAQRHSGRMAVTAFVDDLKFEQPVKVGQVVRLESQVTAVFRSSIEIEVVVEGEDATTGRRWPCVHARLTFVAIVVDRKSTRLNSSHLKLSRMPSSA